MEKTAFIKLTASPKYEQEEISRQFIFLSNAVTKKDNILEQITYPKIYGTTLNFLEVLNNPLPKLLFFNLQLLYIWCNIANEVLNIIKVVKKLVMDYEKQIKTKINYLYLIIVQINQKKKDNKKSLSTNSNRHKTRQIRF